MLTCRHFNSFRRWHLVANQSTQSTQYMLNNTRHNAPIRRQARAKSGSTVSASRQGSRGGAPAKKRSFGSGKGSETALARASPAKISAPGRAVLVQWKGAQRPCEKSDLWLRNQCTHPGHHRQRRHEASVRQRSLPSLGELGRRGKSLRVGRGRARSALEKSS